MIEKYPKRSGTLRISTLLLKAKGLTTTPPADASLRSAFAWLSEDEDSTPGESHEAGAATELSRVGGSGRAMETEWVGLGLGLADWGGLVWLWGWFAGCFWFIQIE